MQHQTKKDEYAIILDYLPRGYATSRRPEPVAQAITTESFTLLELKPRENAKLELLEKVYIGEGERDKIERVLGRLPYRRLTATAQSNLEKAIEQIIDENPQRFVDFYNKAESINIREHQLDLLPGIGKKTLWEILEKRKDKPFESFEDIKERVAGIGDPKKLIIKRIVEELQGNQKIYLFTRPPALPRKPSFRRPGFRRR